MKSRKNRVGSLPNEQLIKETRWREEAEIGWLESKERYWLLLEHLPVGVYRTTPLGQIIECNQALARMLGYRSVREMSQVNVNDFYVKKVDRAEHLQKLKTSLTYFSVFELRLRDGRHIWVRDYPRAVRGPDNQIVYFDGILVDITEQKMMEETIRQMAYHDTLTGLSNRLLFRDRMGQALARAKRLKQKLALMFLDLDYFKEINDRYGHEVGDWVLQGVAHRLMRLLRRSDTVARLGGDEFLILTPDLIRVSDAIHIGQKILKAFQRPIAIEKRRIGVTTSIGMAIYPLDSKTAGGLISKADQAMYHAKAMGRNNIQRFKKKS